ncbi:ParB/RepB/Spo0J family partition protein [Alkalibacter rhizosphaerae]|uniref:ParB/RepB/Spo0J family partition protein n=1 Tax=Alkalibacter rhizosphaerae TaxID=2815577 RepID=A0A974XD81_9FIRM|nr:ParB/RepB/Spo0J family partition protein [Alkalibacter rhizosphaerae]QSX07571.1 ParB/RepB/Spo0J family partition protein [Alkalibacter rhizosphaerae]
MKTKKGLGRGLQALIPEEQPKDNEGVLHVPIDRIYPNKNQPRVNFDKEKLEELASSIKEHGVIQPIVISKEEDGYKIIAGERRWRGAKMAGLKEIPAIIMSVTEMQIMELALIENLQREDLNEIEAASAYRDLMDQFKLTQQEIAQRLGKSRTAIANTLRLLNLPKDIQKLIENNTITPGHGRCILSLEGEKRQILLERILKDKLSVREAEKLVQTLKKDKPVKKEKDPNPALDRLFIQDLEEQLQHVFGTKVNIQEKNNRGKIEIEFYGNDDLERIMELLSKR